MAEYSSYELRWQWRLTQPSVGSPVGTVLPRMPLPVPRCVGGHTWPQVPDVSLPGRAAASWAQHTEQDLQYIEQMLKYLSPLNVT